MINVTVALYAIAVSIKSAPSRTLRGSSFAPLLILLNSSTDPLPHRPTLGGMEYLNSALKAMQCRLMALATRFFITVSGDPSVVS